jgi:hypothetical protein
MRKSFFVLPVACAFLAISALTSCTGGNSGNNEAANDSTANVSEAVELAEGISYTASKADDGTTTYEITVPENIASAIDDNQVQAYVAKILENVDAASLPEKVEVLVKNAANGEIAKQISSANISELVTKGKEILESSGILTAGEEAVGAAEDANAAVEDAAAEGTSKVSEVVNDIKEGAEAAKETANDVKESVDAAKDAADKVKGILKK